MRGFLQAAGRKPAVFVCNEAFRDKNLATTTTFPPYFCNLS
jgi:hypothetical protein